MSDDLSKPQQGMVDAVKRRAGRERAAGRLPPIVRQIGQIGVLGWQIVVPALLGLAIGRWLDHRFASGIFWTAAMLAAGLALGCWSAWRWIQRQ